MKPRDSVLRVKRFDAQEKTRKAADIEMMIRDFEQMAADLVRQISAEEERTGIKDRNHFAYSTFAKAAQQRRQKLLDSVDDLKMKLETAIKARDEAVSELEKLEGNGHRTSDNGRNGADSSSANAGGI